MSQEKLKLVVLISGGGSNLLSLIRDSQQDDAPFEICGVISNRADAGGLQHAANAGIPSQVIDHSQYQGREAFDKALIEAIDSWQPDLVVLAGFMRILTDEFVTYYLNRMINIHPALLPAYPGLNTHQRVIDAGETYHGASVHYVIPELDAGPVIIQARLKLVAGESASELAARVLKMEHQIYPQAVRWIAEGRITANGSQALLDGELLPTQGHQISV